MKRNNGYLQLSFDSRILDLIKEDIITILNRNKVCFYINSLKLFFKEENKCYQELIGTYIANYLKINSVNYDMLEFITFDKNYKGVISEDFRLDGYELITFDLIIDEYLTDNHIEVLNNDMNLELLECALNNRYSNYENRKEIVSKLMDNIKKSFLFDLLIGNIDNGKYNYSLMESNADSLLTPYFDYEEIFKFSSTRLTVSDNSNYDIYDNLLLFLNSNNEYLEYFKICIIY